ncbi:hypothetical protein Vafri_7866, partial [Volvox africanus]
TGPLYCLSMFKPESIWGTLGRWAHSKRFMEASMFYSAMDREVTLGMRQRYSQPEESGGVPAAGGRHNAVEEWDNNTEVDGGMDDEEPDMWNETDLFSFDPVIHVGRSAGFIEISNAEIDVLDKMYERSELHGAKRGGLKVEVLKELWVGHVKLEEGSWFLCRPDGDGAVQQAMWFGKVNAILRHRGGDG